MKFDLQKRVKEKSKDLKTETSNRVQRCISYQYIFFSFVSFLHMCLGRQDGRKILTLLASCEGLSLGNMDFSYFDDPFLANARMTLLHLARGNNQESSLTSGNFISANTGSCLRGSPRRGPI